ncbi:YciI family protein [Streptomyces flaveolus]|uniref:YciI family protein n=1 Tax=Streptomyces flaveolus TaxID=67297 RepID=UPI003404C3E6
MDAQRMPWDELISWSQDHNLLAKRLYVVISEPTNGIGPVLENLEPHVAYQTKLENDGVMFAAGPVADDAEQEWPGGGFFIYRAQTRADAVKLADGDPMHIAGARRFVVHPWLLNEGTFSVRLFYSGGRPEII